GRASGGGAGGPSTPAPGWAAGSAGPATPSAAFNIPSHIAGATAGSASRLATSPASGTAPKWNATGGAVAGRAGSLPALPAARRRSGTRRAERLQVSLQP